MEYSLWHIVTQPAVLSRLWFTIWQSSLTVVIALLVGGGLAVAERWLRETTPRWFTTLCSLVVFLPPLMITTGFIATYGKAGLLNWLLTSLGIEPVQLLYTKAAVVLAHSYYNIPLAFLLVRAGLAAIPKTLEDSAAVLGARGWHRLTQLFWPYLRRPLFGVSALIFLYCFTSFIVPLQLGGNQAQTLEVWLYQEIYLYHRYAVAAWVAGLQFFVLAVCVSALLWAQPKIASQKNPSQKTAVEFSKKIRRPTHVALSGLRLVATAFLITPLLLLLVRATTTLSGTPLTALWHSQFFTGLGRSLLVAATALLITIALVFSTRLPSWLGLVLVAISPITITFIWFTTFGKGYPSLIGAFIIILLPVVALIFQTVRAKQPRWLMGTARLLGASRLQQRLLDWRLTTPAVSRSIALGGIIILGDATLSSLLSRADQPLAMPVVLNFIASYRFGLGSMALAVMLVLFILTLSITYARD